MSKRGRKPKADPPVRWELSLPLSLATEIELALLDPLRGKVAHGARTDLVTMLLRQWLASQSDLGDNY